MDGIDNFAGFTNAKFAPLKEAFIQNFQEDDELGASVVVYKGGEIVASLHGGWCDENKKTPWTEESVMCTMSAVKGPTSICLHLLIDRGELELNQPVADVWPEFAQNGKEAITIRNVLTHQSGLPALPDAPVGCGYNWGVTIKAIEDHAPVIEPGASPAYHGHTFGYLAGEIIRRQTGLMPGDFFTENIAMPFDVDYELRWRERFEGRTSRFVPSFFPPPDQMHTLAPVIEAMVKGDDWRPKMGSLLFVYYDTFQEPWRSFESPAVFGHGSAKGLAKLYAILAEGGALNGKRLISEAGVARMQEECWHETELTTNGHWRYGLGFMQDTPKLFPCGEGGFGHPGNGGAMGFANPRLGLSFAYVMNRRHIMNSGMAEIGPRATRLATKTLEIASDARPC
ncbi:MAG: serine hydrolase domain-containing protein [Pseudomonadota bacterium]